MHGRQVPTLIEWIGGPKRVELLIERFYDVVLKDELLEPLFRGMDGQHFRYVAMFIAEVFDGPKAYSESRGGHAHMIRKHLGKGITEHQRQRWVTLLMTTADAVGVPDDPEFRSAFVSYIEWGSRLAVLNSQPGAEVEADLPMPRWGWGEVGGPYVDGAG